MSRKLYKKGCEIRGRVHQHTRDNTQIYFYCNDYLRAMSDAVNNPAFSVDGKTAIVTGAGSGLYVLAMNKGNLAEGSYRN